jgi:tetratricopeptide (TPR) repeat protein
MGHGQHDLSLNLGVIYKSRGDLKTALEYFTLATTQSPTYYLAYINGGITLQELNKSQEAITFFFYSSTAKPK